MSLEHWESYYRGGALATCPMGPAKTYTLELREVWTEFFRELPDAARILDVGTGNGAIALIAKETAASLGRRFEIHGTDLARIDPARHVRGGATLFAGIEFHAGIATEQLPFASASFDAVSGQYALEYTAIEPALTEIYRVLMGGRRAQFIAHHASSVVVRNARESLQHADLVLKETKLFRKLRRHVEAEGHSPAVARRSWQELVAAVTRLRGAAATAETSLVLRVSIDAAQKLLDARRRLGRAALDLQIDRVEADVRASVRRLRDLVASALSEQDVATLRSKAETAGFVGCEVRAQNHAGENLVGWRVNLAKP